MSSQKTQANNTTQDNNNNMNNKIPTMEHATLSMEAEHAQIQQTVKRNERDITTITDTHRERHMIDKGETERHTHTQNERQTDKQREKPNTRDTKTTDVQHRQTKETKHDVKNVL